MKRKSDEAFEDFGNKVRRKDSKDQNVNNKLDGSNCQPRFSLRQIQSSRSHFPYYRQPREIGFFSLDIQRKFYDDKSQLKFYIAPSNAASVNFNLREGYKDLIKKDESVKEFIDDLLRWVLVHKQLFVLRDSEGNLPSDETLKSLNTDFICWRGLLTKLLCTPFERRDGWLIAIILYRGTYYMCEYDTEERKHQKQRITQRQDEMCYWGWKFEQYLVADSPKKLPDTTGPVNNCEAYCTVVRSRLTSHSMVFAGEVDGLDPKSTEPCKYVELKTSREIDNRRQDENFKRFKLIKWWAQSFLPGVPTVICGFRDDSGVVHRLQTYKTLDIPAVAKDINDPWDAATCFNFLDKFFHFVKESVKVDDPRVVHLFSWSPGEDITCEDMGTDSEYSFLPHWYIDKLFPQT
ncbi:decapping and exoribonuclease protein-like [Liolophura sinensis]|uniref:decapping and exoribonuclease protein-like n=1 Tax=Liolophura sinensis TaxID=3198878 RepID=UPI003158ADE7